MAASYVPQGSSRDIQVLGPTQVVDVERVSATTIPSGVWFEVLVPIAAVGTTDAAAIATFADVLLTPLAEGIEANINPSRAVSAVFVEDIDANGFIAFFVEFQVCIPAPSPGQVGPFCTTVRVPANALTDRAGIGATVEPAFAAAFDLLHRLAGL